MFLMASPVTEQGHSEGTAVPTRHQQGGSGTNQTTNDLLRNYPLCTQGQVPWPSSGNWVVKVLGRSENVVNHSTDPSYSHVQGQDGG